MALFIYAMHSIAHHVAVNVDHGDSTCRVQHSYGSTLTTGETTCSCHAIQWFANHFSPNSLAVPIIFTCPCQVCQQLMCHMGSPHARPCAGLQSGWSQNSVVRRAFRWVYVGKHVELIQTGQNVKQHVDKQQCSAVQTSQAPPVDMRKNQQQNDGGQQCQRGVRQTYIHMRKHAQSNKKLET